MKPVRLFDYQTEMRDRVLEALREHNAVMVQMPTGTGKTHVLAAVISEWMKGEGTKIGQKTRILTKKEPTKGEHTKVRPVWVVAHRRELVEQIRRTWEKFYKGKRNAPEVRVISIQWLSRNWDAVAGDRPAMIVIDEAHHALAETYRELFRRYPEAKKLGMTATPYRLSGKGFADLFQLLLESRTAGEFILMKRLSLFDYYTLPADSKIRRRIALLKKRGADGDYQAGETEAALNTPGNIEYLYNSLTRYARGRRGIVYAINISHARAIAAYYASRGLRCCAIDCDTPQKERDGLVEAFRRGDIDVMVNVDIFSEGFDCPEVEFIQLARPTLSLAVYLQQVGRGLRKARGKKYCVILDNVGLSRTFGTPVRKWDWQRIFRGNHGNLRIDPGDSRDLIKHLGHPGKLVDEPMELAVYHGDMDLAIKHKGLLEFDPKEGQIAVRLDGRVVVRKPVTKVLSYRDGAVALLLKDRTACLILPSGRELKMPGDMKDFRLLENDLLKVVTAKREYYLDLVTGLRFAQCPKIENYGPFIFVNDGKRLWRRLRDYKCNYECPAGKPTSWNGYYLMISDVGPLSAGSYIPGGNFGRDRKTDSAKIVLFPRDLSAYYLVAELSNRSIVVVDRHRHYYQVNPDLTRKYLFTASPYRSTKWELEQWLVKLNK